MATLSTARLTALSKRGVRGIATGEVLRRLASRVLARQYAEIFDAATRPFQYALRTRAGTDCLAAILRTAAELDETATIVSLDGRAAYDTVSRAAMFHKLFEVAPALVPFVRGIYGRTSSLLLVERPGGQERNITSRRLPSGRPSGTRFILPGTTSGARERESPRTRAANSRLVNTSRPT